MKNFLSHSRERLDNFVGKFSSKKNEQNGLESAASVGAGLGMGFNPLGGFELGFLVSWDWKILKVRNNPNSDNYRAMQQKKRREGTLSPRSTEYQYMIKECVNYLRPVN